MEKVDFYSSISFRIRSYPDPVPDPKHCRQDSRKKGGKEGTNQQKERKSKVKERKVRKESKKGKKKEKDRNKGE